MQWSSEERKCRLLGLGSFAGTEHKKQEKRGLGLGAKMQAAPTREFGQSGAAGKKTKDTSQKT